MTDDEFTRPPFAEAGSRIVMSPEAFRKLLAQLDNLRSIVRARTHREHGCICPECVEDEVAVGKVVEELLAEVERLKADLETEKRHAAEDDADIDRLLTKALGLPADEEGCFLDPNGDGDICRNGALAVAEIAAERLANRIQG